MPQTGPPKCRKRDDTIPRRRGVRRKTALRSRFTAVPGVISREPASAERVLSYHEGLRRALATGRNLLALGGSALDAVTEAVAVLEDDPLFNAGRGRVYTRAGTREMDACVMDGADGRAGAVAGILGPRNPVRAARAVLERSPHVLLVGAGAVAFCREAGAATRMPTISTGYAATRRSSVLAET
jgi:beta-aspartyl-peptidase (threonine type)